MISYLKFYKSAIAFFIIVIQIGNLSVHILAKSHNKNIVAEIGYTILNFFYEKEQYIKKFLILDKENEKLARENAFLYQYIANLNYHTYSVNERYGFEPANVVSSSTISSKNFITIDKGSDHGIQKGMGIFSGKTIVGRVFSTSKNFSVVISILNSSVWVPVEIDGKGIFCSANWSKDLGSNRVMIVGPPAHAVIEVGDKVVTSGHSDVFPKGLALGTVHSVSTNPGGTRSIIVQLGEDIVNIKTVFIVKNVHLNEQTELENSIVDEI